MVPSSHVNLRGAREGSIGPLCTCGIVAAATARQAAAVPAPATSPTSTCTVRRVCVRVCERIAACRLPLFPNDVSLEKKGVGSSVSLTLSLTHTCGHVCRPQRTRSEASARPVSASAVPWTGAACACVRSRPLPQPQSSALPRHSLSPQKTQEHCGGDRTERGAHQPAHRRVAREVRQALRVAGRHARVRLSVQAGRWARVVQHVLERLVDKGVGDSAHQHPARQQAVWPRHHAHERRQRHRVLGGLVHQHLPRVRPREVGPCLTPPPARVGWRQERAGSCLL